MQIKAYRTFPTGEKPLAVGLGAAFATDLVTVHKHPVGYMYRDSPDSPKDSGWRFLAGFESDEYMDDPNNMGVFDVNTIANYDPDIVPFLTAPVGSAFARNDETGAFAAAAAPFAVQPGAVVAEGTFLRARLTQNWTMVVEDGYRRRTEADNLVLWAPGKTIWVSEFAHEQSREAMMLELKDMAPSVREATFVDPREDVLRYAYLAPKADGDQRAWGLMTFCVASSEYIVVAFYFDDRRQLDWALDCWKSIMYDPA